MSQWDTWHVEMDQGNLRLLSMVQWSAGKPMRYKREKLRLREKNFNHEICEQNSWKRDSRILMLTIMTRSESLETEKILPTTKYTGLLIKRSSVLSSWNGYKYNLPEQSVRKWNRMVVYLWLKKSRIEHEIRDAIKIRYIILSTRNFTNEMELYNGYKARMCQAKDFRTR